MYLREMLNPQEEVNRRIELCTTALLNCKSSGSDWGVQYWENVIRSLNRKGIGMLHE